METREPTIGQWIKRRRKALGLTQDDLARRVPCSVVMIRKIEADERRPSKDLAARLADCLDIRADQRAAWMDLARAKTGEVKRTLWSQIFRPSADLPIPPTPLIGRAQDVAAVRTRLLRDDVRLLTLIGAPGIGKTRLALAVGENVRDGFEDGVHWVELAPIREPELVATTIAQALGLTGAGPQSPRSRVLQFTQDKQMLLLLDNFEQVVAAAAFVAYLLAASPWLRVLVTSRVALRVRAERQFPVPPLALPDLARLPPLELFLECPSVALFAERSQAVAPEFAVNDSNARAVATICHRLDGLPLAIELIAARSQVLTPRDLLARLGGDLLLRSDGLRDVSDRQRTLSSAIGWSCDLLDAREQALFRRLAVFVGGWTFEAAEGICKDEGGRQKDEKVHPSSLILHPSEVLDTLTALVNKSLVQRRDVDGETRFTLLETIREYALEKLQAGEESDTFKQRHAEYYLALVEQASQHFADAEQIGWSNRLRPEYNNLRATLEWLLERGDADECLRFVGAVWQSWHNLWHLGEGRHWLEQALANTQHRTASESRRIGALNGAGILAYLQCDYVAARAYHDQALARARATDDKWGIAYSLYGLGNPAMNQGDYVCAATAGPEGLALARETGDKWLTAMILNTLGEMARLQGDLEKAMPMFEEGIALLSELGDKVFITIPLDNLGMAVWQRGDCERATAIHARCLRLAHAAGDFREIALAIERLAAIAQACGQPERAARLFGAAEALRQARGAPVEVLDRAEYDRAVAAVRAQLDEATRNAAWREGGVMSLEQAVACALARTE